MRRFSLALALLILAGPASAQQVQLSPGTYSFSYGGQTLTITSTTPVVISWGVAPVPVPPTPTPVPPPTPAPPVVPILTGEAWALIVYEGAIPPAATSKAVHDAAENLTIHVDPVPSTAPRVAGYLAKAREVGLPAVLIIQEKPDGSGDVKHVTKLPGDEAGAIALFKQIRGKM
jgi:hypothetical protein